LAAATSLPDVAQGYLQCKGLMIIAVSFPHRHIGVWVGGGWWWMVAAVNEPQLIGIS